MNISADIRGMSIEQVAQVAAEAISALLKNSEDKFVDDVTQAGVLTEEEAKQVLSEHRSVIADEMREPFAKMFEDLRSKGAGGGETVETKALESGAIVNSSETSTISGNS